MKHILLLLLLSVVVYSSQYVPIPKRQIGFLTGNPAAQVKIELVYDPVCDDSAAFDIKFQQAYNSLSAQIKSQTSVRFLILILPYHILSHKLTQALIIVNQNKGPQQAVTLLREFLTYKEQWYEQNTRNQTINHVMLRIAEKINTMFGLKTEDVLKELAHFSKTEPIARDWSKLVMGSMKVNGTPKIRVNGVTVDGTEKMSVQDISNLIKTKFTTSSQDF